MTVHTHLTQDELYELDFLDLQRELAVIKGRLREIATELPKLAGKVKELTEEAKLLAMEKSIVQTLLRVQASSL